jgi:hypothetical protein
MIVARKWTIFREYFDKVAIKETENTTRKVIKNDLVKYLKLTAFACLRAD